MGILFAERPNAFFEREQRFIDFGTFHASLAIGRRCIGATFVARQIDEREFAVDACRTGWPQHDLENGMRTRRIGIGRRLARRARQIAVLNQLQHLFDTVDHFLGETDHLHLLFAVLEHAQLLFVAEQIEHFATVDFEEAARHHQIQMLVLGPIQQCEYVLSGHCVDTIFTVLRFAIELAAHCVRFARTSLTVRETCGHTALEYGLHQWLRRVLVNQFVGARIVERIVETEFMIFQIFG